MALKKLPVIDAAEAPQDINYFEEADGSLTPVAKMMTTGGSGVSRFVNPSIKLASSTTETILSVSAPIVIEVLEVATNSPDNMRILFNPSGAGLYVPIHTDGDGNDSLTMAALNRHGSSLFETLYFNESTHEYKMALSRPFASPNGLLLQLSNQSPALASVSVFCYYRPL